MNINHITKGELHNTIPISIVTIPLYADLSFSCIQLDGMAIQPACAGCTVHCAFVREPVSLASVAAVVLYDHSHFRVYPNQANYAEFLSI